MKKIFKLLPLSFTLLCVAPLTSCGENMDEYVGTWRIGLSWEKTEKYYWGNTTLIDSKEVSGARVGLTVNIQKNKKVTYTFPNSDTENTGKVGFMFGKLYFKDLPFSNDYKFELGENSDHKKILEHTWSENKFGLEYTQKSRRICFVIVS